MTDPTPLDLDAIEERAKDFPALAAEAIAALIEQVRKLTQEAETYSRVGSEIAGKLAQAEQRVKDLLEENIELHESRVGVQGLIEALEIIRDTPELGRQRTWEVASEALTTWRGEK